FLVLRGRGGRAVNRRLHLAEKVSDAAKVPCREKVYQRRIEYAKNLLTDAGIPLLLEDVEQRRRHARAKILLVLAADLAVEVLDLVLVEKVDRGAEVGAIDDSSGRR